MMAAGNCNAGDNNHINQTNPQLAMDTHIHKSYQKCPHPPLDLESLSASCATTSGQQNAAVFRQALNRAAFVLLHLTWQFMLRLQQLDVAQCQLA